MDRKIRFATSVLMSTTLAIPAGSGAQSLDVNRMTPILAQQLLNSLRVVRSAGGTAYGPCSADANDDDCKPEIRLVIGKLTYPGAKDDVDVCVAITPDVDVRIDDKATKPKKVKYTLDRTLVATAEFHDFFLISDKKGNIDSDPDIGKHMLTIFTKRKSKKKADDMDQEIVFLPIIKWENKGVLDLCHAVDPKIVNVQ